MEMKEAVSSANLTSNRQTTRCYTKLHGVTPQKPVILILPVVRI